MQLPEDEIPAIREAHEGYEQCRQALHDSLSEMDPEQFDRTLSLAEEFGANHVRTMLQERAERRMKLASLTWFDELERKLQSYVEATEGLDRAVAEHDPPVPASSRTMAIHGVMVEVDPDAMTITFPGRTAEPLVLEEGSGPAPSAPEPSRDRRRSRGRGR
jgi:hypothetical protein